MKRLLPILALLCASCFGQSWTGILATSRAINWANAGLPATFPDGETTTNGWTPPTRTQSGSTISAGASASTINTALSSCPNAEYVLLGSGVFTTTSNINLFSINSCTLRGSGANSTFLYLSGGAQVAIGAASGAGSATWSAGYSQGTTSITLTGAAGTTLSAGNLLHLTQCQTGLSGSGCGTGTITDNGGVFFCSGTTACAQQTTVTGGQGQTVWVTNVSGTCSSSCTVTISPGLYMENWSSGSSPTASWQDPSYVAKGIGLEDMTIVVCENGSLANCSSANTASHPVSIYEGYGSWMKGIRIVGEAGNDALYIQNGKSNLLFNSYIFSDLKIDSADGGCLGMGGDSDDLILNNSCEFGFMMEGTGAEEGNVYAYNYGTNSNAGYVQNSYFEHAPGTSLLLKEANQSGVAEDDNTFGTHNLITSFRNLIVCGDPPFTGLSSPRGILLDSFARFENVIFDVIGSSNCTNYESTVASPQSAYEVGWYGGVAPTDTLTQTTGMLWGNYDEVNAAVRFNSGEVPTTLSGNATPYENPVPGTHNGPCSMFLSTYTGTTCTPLTSGGSGLSWYKVCTSWTTFPTSCATYTTPTFPPNGPDITGGAYLAGYGNDNPAAVAWKHLPPDPTFQTSYSIGSSSWTSGVETIVLSSGVPNQHHLMGKFQINGGNCGTSGAGTSTGAELQITSSSSATTFTYALASNPGSCAGGSFLFPDVREFDEKVYQADNTSQASSPSCSPGSGTYTGSQSVTCTNPNSGTTVMCYATGATTPVTNGAGTGCTTGTQYTTAITVSSSETLNIVAGTSTLSDSNEVSYVYTIITPTGSLALTPGNTLSIGTTVIQ